jgi:hypothetical protein
VSEARIDPRQSLVDFLATTGSWTAPIKAIDLGEERWLPDLEGPEKALLHLALDEIESPWVRRIEAASNLGYVICIACLPQALTIDNLELIQEVDGKPILIDDSHDEPQISEYNSVADLISQYELSLNAADLRRLAQPLLSKARACSNSYKKGLLFEQVLCLIFSQTSYFRVMEHRYINETEEIDIVLGNRATGELAGVLGSPLVLASGKNQAKAVGAPEVRALRGNMANRRGRCTFGILASASRIAGSAKTEQVRATTDPSLAVSLLDGEAIDGLLSSPDLDAALEKILLAAVMD